MASSFRPGTQRRLRGRSAIAISALVSAFGLVVLAAAGCQSTSARAFVGARHYAAGTRALREGHTGPAIEELEQAARLVPQASEIQNHLGLAYWSEGRLERAEQAFQQALVLDCDNEPARLNLALLHRQARKRSSGPVPSASRSADAPESSPTSGPRVSGIGGSEDGG